MSQFKVEKTYVFEAKDLYTNYIQTTVKELKAKINKINKQDLVQVLSDIVLKYWNGYNERILPEFIEQLETINTNYIDESDFYFTIADYVQATPNILGEEFNKILNSDEQFNIHITFNEVDHYDDHYDEVFVSKKDIM